MRRSVLAFAVCLIVGSLSSLVSADYNYLYKAEAVGFTFGLGNHAWANSWTCTGTGKDYSESWVDQSACAKDGSGCAGCSANYHANSANTVVGNSATTLTSSIQSNYLNSRGTMTYLVNGVCHQSANRALARTATPYVRNTPIGLGTVSYALFCDCGVSLFGTCWSCTF